MRSTILPGIALFGGLLFLAPLVRGDGQPPKTTVTVMKAPDPKKTPSAELPLDRIVLFNAGIGYFHREGDVTGDAHFDLRFDESDVNDLLKSLILSDKDGGKVRAVTYDNRLPVDFTLKGFAVDVTENPTMGQLLHQVRGEKVEVTDRGGVATVGQIVSVQHPPPPPMGADPGELLNLLADDGLQTVELKQLKKIKFVRPELQAEFKKALELLASSHGDNKKTVSIVFSGNGKRRVAVGYVTEAPLWKPSYRLSVDDKGTARLQGWATVENTTDEDWTNVKIGLVAGRPMTFQMDLYDPLFVPRPMVEPELFASLRPPMYQGGLNPAGMAVGVPPNAGAAGMFGMAGIGGQGQLGQGQLGNNLGFGGGFQGIGGGQFGQYSPGGMAGSSPYLPRVPRVDVRTMYGSRLSYAEYVERLHGNFAETEADKPATVRDPLDKKGGALAAADAPLGDMFEYKIEEPVTLPRQKSALLPIANEVVDVARVSIYNARVLAKHPLLGLKLANKTKLTFAQGPVAVYEGGVYAGDARLPDLKPNERQLVSYAIDLGTEVVPLEIAPDSTYDSIKVLKGSLIIKSHDRWTTRYVIRNRNPVDRTVMIEHPRRDGRKLLGPAKATDQTRSFYRFEVTVKSGELATFEVIEQSEHTSHLDIAENRLEMLEAYLKNDAVTPVVREILKKVVDLRGKIVETQQAIAAEQVGLRVIDADQERIRKNLETLPRESDTFKRYLKKMDDQETEIEKRQARIKSLTVELEKRTAALRDFARTANAE
jgi:hypothetical protein